LVRHATIPWIIRPPNGSGIAFPSLAETIDMVVG